MPMKRCGRYSTSFYKSQSLFYRLFPYFVKFGIKAVDQVEIACNSLSFTPPYGVAGKLIVKVAD